MYFLAVHVCRLFMNCSENIQYLFTLFIWPFLLVGLRICVDCQIDENNYIFLFCHTGECVLFHCARLAASMANIQPRFFVCSKALICTAE